MASETAIDYSSINGQDRAQEKLQALELFSLVAPNFSESNILTTLTTAEEATITQTAVLPVENSPAQIKELMGIWRMIKLVEADIAEFDDETEQAIFDDPRFQALITERKLPLANQEDIKRKMLRLRFTIFSIRLAAQQDKTEVKEAKPKPA